MAKRKRSSRALQATAYHEAGHAVVRWHHRLKRPKYVTIISDEDYWGAVFGPAFPRGFDPGIDYSGRVRLLLERRIRSLLAGPLAQKKFHPRGFRHAQAASDYDQIADLGLRLGGDGETASAYIKLLELQTRNILNQDWIWQCVEAVAEALLEKKKLSGKETSQIIKNSLDCMIRRGKP